MSGWLKCGRSGLLQLIWTTTSRTKNYITTGCVAPYLNLNLFHVRPYMDSRFIPPFPNLLNVQQQPSTPTLPMNCKKYPMPPNTPDNLQLAIEYAKKHPMASKPEIAMTYNVHNTNGTNGFRRTSGSDFWGISVYNWINFRVEYMQLKGKKV